MSEEAEQKDAPLGGEGGSEIESNEPNGGSGRESQEMDPISSAKKEAADNHEKYLRALADFDNFKKRAIKERSELLRYQGENIVVDLLEVADNLDRAVSNKDVEKDQLFQGVQMIQKLFHEILSKNGIKGESAVGKEFDPKIHQALSQVPSKDHKVGTVISELKKPYYYKDKLIRVGQVVVAGQEVAN